MAEDETKSEDTQEANSEQDKKVKDSSNSESYKCGSCGANVIKGSNYCGNCGATLDTSIF